MINNLHIIHKQDFRLYRKYSNFNISFQSILFKTIPLDLSYNFLLESLKNMYKVSKINFIGIYSYKFLPTARVNLSLERTGNPSIEIPRGPSTSDKFSNETTRDTLKPVDEQFNRAEGFHST